MKRTMRVLFWLGAICVLIGSNFAQSDDLEATRYIINHLPPAALKELLRRGQELEGRQKESMTRYDALSLRIRKEVLESEFQPRGRRPPSIICFPRGCLNIADVGIHP